MLIGIVKFVTDVDISPATGPGSNSLFHQLCVFFACVFVLVLFVVNTFTLLLAMSFQLGPIPVILVTLLITVSLARL